MLNIFQTKLQVKVTKNSQTMQLNNTPLEGPRRGF